MSRSSSITAIVLCAAAGATACGPATAHSRVPVKFAHGSDAATLNGSVTGHEYVDYVLGAQAGQTMSVDLKINDTTGDGTIYFNILPPGSDDIAIFNGSVSPDSHGEVRLPNTGDYTIRVYLMGNDEDAGKTVGYTIEASIR